MRRKLTAALLTAAMAISLQPVAGQVTQLRRGVHRRDSKCDEAAGTTTASRKEVLRVAMSADYAPFDWLQVETPMSSDDIEWSYMNGYDVLCLQNT